jgi:DNA-binding beta-propeller fold protein YncE
VRVAVVATAVLTMVLPVGADLIPRASAITPIPVDSIPSPAINGHAGVYAWGAATMPDGSVIVGDYWNGRVLHYAMDGAELGVLFSIVQPGAPVTSNTAPYGLAVDDDGVVYVGTYYIAPKIPSVVQRWAPNGSGDYQQIAPITYPGFKYPSRVAIADDGRIYVSDMQANKIFVFHHDGSFDFSWGSTGTATGQFKQPRGLAFDQGSPQRLYVADANNIRIQVFTPSGQFVTSWKTKKGNLRGLDVDGSTVFVVSIAGQTVYKYSLTGTFLGQIGTAGGLSQTTCCSTPGGQFSNGGREVTISGDGRVWVGDMPNFRVQVFNQAGTFQFARPNPPQNPANGGFNAPRGVTVDADGNVIVADSYNQRIQKLDPSGSWIWSIGVRGNATGYFLNYPGDVAADRSDGSIVVADTANNRIKKFTAGGVLVWQEGTAGGSGEDAVNQPAGIAVGPDGKVYVADTLNKRIKILDGSDGTFLSAFGGTNLGSPVGVAVDPATGTIYVADTGKKAIQVFSSGGSFLRSITQTAMKRPYDVAVDGSRIYVPDRGQHKFFMFDKNSSGSAGFQGSFGGMGTGMNQFRDPQGISYYAGKIYISDVQNDRIQVWCVSAGCGA